MFKKNISGQFLYFGMVSALSGNPVTGISGSISGRRSVDGGTLGLLSGNIVEPGGGLFQANLHDFDTNGNNIGFLFTASGCVPATFTVVTVGGVSGSLYLASGNTVNVFSGQLSGQRVDLSSGISFIASGNTVNVFSGQLSGQRLDLTSGVSFIASGNTVRVFSGQLSGHAVDLLSGYSYTASGINATVPPITIASGTTYLASGTPLFYSGHYFLASGQNVNVFSGQLSGHQVDLLSGRSYPASGVYTVATATVASGQVYLASGTPLFYSGYYFIASGQNVNVFSGQLSGQQVNILSGNQVQVWSGTQVNVFSGQFSGQPMTLLSGRSYPASGVYTVATATVASGEVYLASGTPLFYSGFFYLASGHAASLYSGQTVGVFSGQLSGQTTVPSSGQGYLASGSVFKNTYASGVIAVDFPYAYLKVDQSGVTGEATRSPINASRKLTNKWDMVTNSGYLTVFKEDDATEAYKQAVTTLSGAPPVTSLDTQ